VISSKKRISCFDQRDERVTMHPILIKIPTLPLELLNEHMLKEIGSSIGI
jgi:hypothetical protein